MSRESRTVLKIFVGSPSDVKAERDAVGRLVDELNKTVASRLGLLLEVVGWESVIRKSGRAQDQINPFLDASDYFIGIMWKKWGMPPDDSGVYTSGFEEEYMRACTLRLKGDGPEMAMFFKEISQEILEYGNETIKRVVGFKQSLIDGYSQFFYDFKETSDFVELIRRQLIEFLFDNATNYLNPPAAVLSIGSPTKGGDKQLVKAANPVSHPLSQKEREFLSTVAGNAFTYDDVSPAAVARLRLIAVRQATDTNDTIVVGVHDCNILYKDRSNQNFGNAEISFIMRSGLEYYKSQVAPVWHWLKLAQSGIVNALVWAVVGKSESQSIGAIRILGLLSADIVELGEYISRDDVVSVCLSQDGMDSFKVEFLKYIALYGRLNDIQFIEEHRESYSSQVRTTANSAIVQLQLLDSTSLALQKLADFNGDVSEITIDVFFGRVADLNADELRSLLTFSSDKIRCLSFKELISRNEVDIDTCRTLLRDDCVEIRYLALLELGRQKVIVSDADAKEILTPKNPSNILSSNKDEKWWHLYWRSKMRACTESELIQSKKLDDVFEWEAELALYSSFYNKHKGELVERLGNGFKVAMEEKFTRADAYVRPISAKTADDVKGLIPFILKSVLTDALEIFSEHAGKSDISLIRTILDEHEVMSSVPVLNYFLKYGEWEDISRLEKFVGLWDHRIHPGLGNRDEEYDIVARAIARVGKDKIISLLQMKINISLLKRVIYYIEGSKFSKINNDEALKLFGNESDDARKAFTLKCLTVFPRSRISELSDIYVSSDEYRYYNVIHWLDMGLVLPSNQTKDIAKKELKALAGV